MLPTDMKKKNYTQLQICFMTRVQYFLDYN